MVLGGRVSVEQGRLLMKALDAMVAEMEKDEREAADAETAGVASQAGEADESGETHEDGGSTPKVARETTEKVSAETSAAASEPNVSAETFSVGKPDTPPFKPLRVRRATALVHIAEHYLATPGLPP